MTRVRDLHAGWMKDSEYRKAYDALEEDFALASTLIRARADAGLTQEQLAERMGTKQEVVARWEGGKVLPSTRTLMRLAKATGTTLRISFTLAPAAAAAKRSSQASRSRSNRDVA
ncbi:MAG TPA: helix-turn-helix transcriptional regulator [Acetobacteraceae bacterium]|jgi:transcriptional regulator with XRE-family HTH domain